MDFIIQVLTDWLKEILVGGIMGNLTGMFDAVNQKVGEVSEQVGLTPQAWNGDIFSMIQNLSETVMVPIAGVILAFVMTLELIQLIVDKNNFHDIESAVFFKWIFKSACAILIVTNTRDIVMGVFDLAQGVVNNASGVIIGDAAIDISSVTADLEARLMEMDLGPLFGLWFQSLFVGMTMWALVICIFGPCPHGNYDEPRVGPDGSKLPAQPVCPGLPSVPYHCMCCHLRGIGAEHCPGR